MQRALLMSRLATVGLALVLLALSGFAIGSGASTRDAGYRAQVAVARGMLFRQARYAITMEAAQEHAYAEELDPQRLARFDQASALAHASLSAAMRASTGQSRATASALLVMNDRYVARFRSLVAATRTGDLAHSAVIEATSLDPLLGQMEFKVGQAAQAESAAAEASLTDLARTEDAAQTSTIVVFALGLALLAVFAFVQHTYRKRVTQTELAYLEQAALSDHLTGLGNHRAFQEALEREMAHVARHGGRLALALIDLDDFKLINDQHGHTHGDRVLAALGALLHGCRAADGAFRLGGDEFAVLMPHTELPDAVDALRRIHRDARRHLFGATLSVGIAALEPESSDGATLREEADAALYEAKRRGRDTIVSFDEIKDSTAITSTTKILAVRRLLAERRIGVAFQPIWDLEQRRILAFEALMRFTGADDLAGPQEAFDVAEKIGRAHDLDAACRAAILSRAAELPRDALLFINVSPQTLDHDVLTGTTLLEEVAAAGLAPGRVVLELTERSMARLSVVVREARRLHGLGFKLALDDTGAGNAGLGMLSQLPVDFVKIDRDVIVKALHDRAARGVLAGIVAIARETGTYVIAEGIEDQAMLDLVRQPWGLSHAPHGIRGVQGYLMGRPSETIPTAHALADYGAALDAA